MSDLTVVVTEDPDNRVCVHIEDDNDLMLVVGNSEENVRCVVVAEQGSPGSGGSGTGSGQGFQRNATSATLINSSTTAVLTLSGNSGWARFKDNGGGWAVVRYTASAATIEASSTDWVQTTTPASAQIGVEVASGVLNVYVGSAAARKIGWLIDNVIL